MVSSTFCSIDESVIYFGWYYLERIDSPGQKPTTPIGRWHPGLMRRREPAVLRGSLEIIAESPARALPAPSEVAVKAGYSCTQFWGE